MGVRSKLAKMDLEGVIAWHECQVQKTWALIDRRDRDARAAFEETQKDLHNLYAKSWGELSPERQQEWRDMVKEKS